MSLWRWDRAAHGPLSFRGIDDIIKYTVHITERYLSATAFIFLSTSQKLNSKWPVIFPFVGTLHFVYIVTVAT